MSDFESKFQYWLENVEDSDLAKELQELKDANDKKAIQDAFYQDLAFGTAGLRGIIGAGTNRMNIYTVGRATQGFADYLLTQDENPSVAIARDSRLMGETFVRRTACVLAANNITAYIYPRIEPTPALSFAVRYLHCTGGINMTASHNPAEYNGYKAYGSDGCQIATQAAKDISEAIAQVDAFTDVKTMDFDEAQEKGLIRWIEEETLQAFLDAVEKSSLEDESVAQQTEDFKVVYTPLNGTGLECVSQILERVGITNVVCVPEQSKPDGHFPTCPYPNPEIREALEKGIELCEEVHSDLLLATDPDADRVGTAVKNGNDYTLISGNEMGVLLLNYIAQEREKRGEDLREDLAVTTIVSSLMVDAIAEHYGFKIKRVLTGFKYIGGVISDLEHAGKEETFLFGFEESYGYLAGTHVRDKDAVVASMLICQMARYYKSRGLNLAQAMEELYEQYGYYENKTLSFSYPGADGAARMQEIMEGLRTEGLSSIAGRDVIQTVDYSKGIDDLPPANVIEFDMGAGNKVLVRPSGTEPKIKAYLFSKGDSRKEALALQREIEADTQSIFV
ncbi:MAG: phospho-sugar mutase [Eggerthellaceae bacterium]|jgi:phosphoglucomutase